MRPAVLIALGILGVGVAAAASSGGDPRRPEPLDVPPAPQAGEMQQRIRAMADAMGLDASWTAFLEAAAMGESGLNTLAGAGIAADAPPWAKINERAAEATGARRAYDRNFERYYKDCPWEASRYTFGSGGLWALLPANGLAAFAGTSEICMDPWAVFEPAPAMAMVYRFLVALMGWSGFKEEPTWGNLRVGMRAPSYMGRPDEIARMRDGKNKLGDRLEQLGYERSFVDALVTTPPSMSGVEALRIVERV